MKIAFEVKRFLWVSLGSTLFVFGISFFIVPATLVPGGITGLAVLSQYGLDLVNIHVNLGLIVIIYNIPVMIIGLKGISKTFVYYSVYSIILQSILLAIFDAQSSIFGSDILASSIFGGLFVGLGAGITLKSGSSLGGMDIISQYISIKLQISVGYISVFVNGLILSIALLIFEPNIAFYTLLSFVVANLLVDQLHTAYKRVRLDIITVKGSEVKSVLISAFIRGITMSKGTGAYTGVERDILWMVTQTHEVYDIKKIVTDIDPEAFITMTPIKHLNGKFNRVIMK